MTKTDAVISSSPLDIRDYILYNTRREGTPARGRWSGEYHSGSTGRVRARSCVR